MALDGEGIGAARFEAIVSDKEFEVRGRSAGIFAAFFAEVDGRLALASDFFLIASSFFLASSNF